MDDVIAKDAQIAADLLVTPSFPEPQSLRTMESYTGYQTYAIEAK